MDIDLAKFCVLRAVQRFWWGRITRSRCFVVRERLQRLLVLLNERMKVENVLIKEDSDVPKYREEKLRENVADGLDGVSVADVQGYKA